MSVVLRKLTEFERHENRTRQVGVVSLTTHPQDF
jgi:hypothetical protein